MPRKYTPIKQCYEEMERLHQEGYSCREIGERFGFTKEQAKEYLRRPGRKAQQEQELVPKRRGRPAKERRSSGSYGLREHPVTAFFSLNIKVNIPPLSESLICFVTKKIYGKGRKKQKGTVTRP